MSLSATIHRFRFLLPGAGAVAAPPGESAPSSADGEASNKDGANGKTKAIADENELAAYLLTGLTVITGILAALGIKDGMVGRMARNEPALTSSAFIAAVFAVFLGIAAASLVNRTANTDNSHRGVSWERWTLAAGLIILFAGGFLAVLGAVRTWGDRTQPQLEAHLISAKDGPALKVHIRTSSLHARDRVMLEVNPVVRKLTADGGLAYVASTPAVYRHSFGPDVDGSVDEQITVPLVAGRYHRLVASAFIGTQGRDCYGSNSNRSCVTFALPEAERPQLHATWVSSKNGIRRLDVHLSAQQVAERIAVIRVYGNVDAHRSRLLNESALAPDANGNIDATHAVPVPPDVSRVCVVASTMVRRPRCPQRYFVVGKSVKDKNARRLQLQAKQRGTVWLAMRAPERMEAK